MRNYYGLGDASSQAPQRIDPDASTFDAQVAFQTLLQEKSLAQLLKAESDLLTEIRELDGERQSLVYNHHHELVSASETIGRVRELHGDGGGFGQECAHPFSFTPTQMKNRADALTPSLNSLNSSLADISRSLQKVQVPQDRVDHARSLQQLAGGTIADASLTPLEAQKIIAPAVELPGRLKDMILLEGGATGLERARGVWGSMEAVLAAWDEAGIAGAKDIMNECRLVLREAQQRK